MIDLGDPPRRRMLRGLAAALTLALAGAAAVDPAPAQGPKKLDVVATTGMIADAVRQVGGERVNVEALMGPGVDPTCTGRPAPTSCA
jgi:manganese/zinc/iron transport system substrate-binding protein